MSAAPSGQRRGGSAGAPPPLSLLPCTTYGRNRDNGDILAECCAAETIRRAVAPNPQSPLAVPLVWALSRPPDGRSANPSLSSVYACQSYHLMVHYRLYFLGRDGHISHALDLECRDDEHAR